MVLGKFTKLLTSSEEPHKWYEISMFKCNFLMGSASFFTHTSHWKTSFETDLKCTSLLSDKKICDQDYWEQTEVRLVTGQI